MTRWSVYIRCMGDNAPFTSLTSPNMRKIEQQMNEAVANNKNWQSANTSVHYNEENGVSIVRLHGNKIAEIGDDYLQIFDGGWQTTTTKSRLNALIDRFCNAVTDGVFQKDYQWYVRDNNVTRDFDNGYIFAWDDYTERLTLSPYSLPSHSSHQFHENCPRHCYRCSSLAIYWCKKVHCKCTTISKWFHWTK